MADKSKFWSFANPFAQDSFTKDTKKKKSKKRAKSPINWSDRVKSRPPLSAGQTRQPVKPHRGYKERLEDLRQWPKPSRARS